MSLTNNLIEAIPKRITSALVDQISWVIVSAFFSFVAELIFSPREVNDNAVYLAIILFSIFLNKDIFFGKSIGKYFLGFRAVSSRTGRPASPIQCSIRNLFLLLWPLEAVILFFYPNRRIGDFVAGTMVQESKEIDHGVKWPYFEAIVSIIGSFTLVYFLFTFIDSLGIMS